MVKFPTIVVLFYKMLPDVTVGNHCWVHVVFCRISSESTSVLSAGRMINNEDRRYNLVLEVPRCICCVL